MQDSAAIAAASVFRVSPAMLFSNPLTVTAANPSTVMINIRNKTVISATPR